MKDSSTPLAAQIYVQLERTLWDMADGRSAQDADSARRLSPSKSRDIFPMRHLKTGHQAEMLCPRAWMTTRAIYIFIRKIRTSGIGKTHEMIGT
jgi:hypothetical protein